MRIWQYDDVINGTAQIKDALSISNCLFCKASLEVFKDWSDVSRPPGIGRRMLLSTEDVGRVECCPVCGWWRVMHWSTGAMGVSGGVRTWSGAAGYLRRLDVSDESTPIQEIRSYLAAKYDDRFRVDPWKFEEVVASVYRDLGYHARATARSGDDGIDVILQKPSGEMVGVQVKRYKDKVKVDQIRELAGALVLNGITRGMFVTTSSFQSGAQTTADRYSSLRGLPIELVDAERFYSDLGLAQRAKYKSARESTAPYWKARDRLSVLEQHNFNVTDLY